MDTRIKITKEQIKWMKETYDRGVEIEGNTYSFSQAGVISDALDFNIDPTPFMNPKFTWQQMFEILQGYLEGIDPTEYIDDNISAKKMGDIRIQKVLAMNPDANPYRGDYYDE